ncbi:MAG: hypothetical protein V4858_10680 [Pseudomonadota bacterium]
MNTHTGDGPDGTPSRSAELLLEVDFKWLMAGQGCWVDPRRLRADPQYAGNCLRAAFDSPCEALRRCARVLEKKLKPSVVAPQTGAAPA